jgi:uncharacterized membrane protein YfcA
MTAAELAPQALSHVPLGFVLGFLIGLTGVGGGAVVAPALYVVLRVPYAEAISLSLIYSLFTKVFGLGQHLRQGTVRWNVTLLYGLTGIPGSVVGSRMLYTVSDETRQVFPLVMSGLLVVVSLLLLAEPAISRTRPLGKPIRPEKIGWRAALGIAAFQLVVGLLLGLTSVGSGSLVLLSMFFLFAMPAREIVGSNIAIALLMVIPASATHFALGGVDAVRLALLLAGSLLGAVLGARTTMVLPDGVLKGLVIALILAGAVGTVLRAL